MGALGVAATPTAKKVAQSYEKDILGRPHGRTDKTIAARRRAAGTPSTTQIIVPGCAEGIPPGRLASRLDHRVTPRGVFITRGKKEQGPKGQKWHR